MISRRSDLNRGPADYEASAGLACQERWWWGAPAPAAAAPAHSTAGAPAKTATSGS